MSRRPTTLRGHHVRYRQATQPLRRTPSHRFPITADNAQSWSSARLTLALATNEAHEWAQWLVTLDIGWNVLPATHFLLPASRAATPGMAVRENADMNVS